MNFHLPPHLTKSETIQTNEKSVMKLNMTKQNTGENEGLKTEDQTIIDSLSLEQKLLILDILGHFFELYSSCFDQKKKEDQEKRVFSVELYLLMIWENVEKWTTFQSKTSI